MRPNPTTPKASGYFHRWFLSLRQVAKMMTAVLVPSQTRRTGPLMMTIKTLQTMKTQTNKKVNHKISKINSVERLSEFNILVF